MLLSIIISFIPLILAIVLHELAHGYAALKCGDDTALINKRLSFNPLKHIDIMGSIIIPALLLFSKTGFVFGWAKPVPVNFKKLNNPQRDTIIVASAGILANLIVAILSALLLKLIVLIPHQLTSGIMTLFMLNMVIFNIVLAIFNALPLPPLDGSKILLGWSSNPKIQKFLSSYKEGTLFIIFIIFVIPLISRYLGFEFNPLGAYIIKTSKTIISWLI